MRGWWAVFWGAVGEAFLLLVEVYPFVLEVPLDVLLETPWEALLEGHLARVTTFVMAVLLHFEWGTALSVGLLVLRCYSVQVEQDTKCRRTTC